MAGTAEGIAKARAARIQRQQAQQQQRTQPVEALFDPVDTVEPEFLPVAASNQGVMSVDTHSHQQAKLNMAGPFAADFVLRAVSGRVRLSAKDRLEASFRVLEGQGLLGGKAAGSAQDAQAGLLDHFAKLLQMRTRAAGAVTVDAKPVDNSRRGGVHGVDQPERLAEASDGVADPSAPADSKPAS